MTLETKIALVAGLAELKVYADRWQMAENQDNVRDQLVIGRLMVDTIRELAHVQEQRL